MLVGSVPVDVGTGKLKNPKRRYGFKALPE
jgi:hypothetical protein